MPTYEYRCNDCGNAFDTFRRIEDDPLTVCERCGGRLRKVFHPAGIVFKGSGFYATDSRSGKKPASKDAEIKGEKTEKKETKPAEKGETKKATEPTS